MDLTQANRAAPTVGSAALKMLDADASGGLNRRELAGHAMFQATFNRADTDGNGALDAAEIDARVETHRTREARREEMNSAVFEAVIHRLVEASDRPSDAGGPGAPDGSETPVRDAAVAQFLRRS